MTATYDGLADSNEQELHVADRKAETEREVGVDKRHTGLLAPTVLLEDLVRVLARSAAHEAYEASQAKKDEDAHG